MHFWWRALLGKFSSEELWTFFWTFLVSLISSSLKVFGVILLPLYDICLKHFSSSRLALKMGSYISKIIVFDNSHLEFNIILWFRGRLRRSGAGTITLTNLTLVCSVLIASSSVLIWFLRSRTSFFNGSTKLATIFSKLNMDC